jgi:hypothetical protein
MRKPTIESMLGLYTAVTGKEPTPELAAMVREAFDQADASRTMSRAWTEKDF